LECFVLGVDHVGYLPFSFIIFLYWNEIHFKDDHVYFKLSIICIFFFKHAVRTEVSKKVRLDGLPLPRQVAKYNYGQIPNRLLRNADTC
jgi:hypothetical protein